MLIDNKTKIGLYDVGDPTKTGIWGWRKRKGLEALKTRQRFTKNMYTPDGLSDEEKLDPETIHTFLDPHQTIENATEFEANPRAGELNRWMQRAFFRRTSKLGIDFATRSMGAKIHFNVDAATDGTDIKPGGLITANSQEDKLKNNRPITISEFRRVLKRARQRPEDFNLYSEKNLESARSLPQSTNP